VGATSDDPAAELPERTWLAREAELLRPCGGEGTGHLDREARSAEREASVEVTVLEVRRLGAELEHEAHIRAGSADAPQAREATGFRETNRAEQRAPGKQDRQPVREPGQLAGSVLQRESAEHRVGASAARSVAQVVRDRVDAHEQDARLELRGPADEGSVTGAEVDVDRLESTGQVGQSSTVYPALFLAFDEVHATRIPRADLARRAANQLVPGRVARQTRSFDT
jgi:hypothetical protein